MPLPGSEGHKNMVEAGEWMDPDMNKYDLTKRVCKHPVRSDEEWDDAVDSAHRAYYTANHMVTILQRMYGVGSNQKLHTVSRLAQHTLYSRGPFRKYKLEGGIITLKYRKDRRPSLPLESPFVFYSRHAFERLWGAVGLIGIWLWLYYQVKRLGRDPKKHEYRNIALSPAGELDDSEPGLMTKTTGALDEAARGKRQSEIIAKAKKRAETSEPASCGHLIPVGML